MSNAKFVTIEGFKDQTGIGRTRAYYLLGEGSLRAIKVGKRTLIDMDHALNWLNNRPTANIQCKRGSIATPLASVS